MKVASYAAVAISIAAAIPTGFTSLGVTATLLSGAIGTSVSPARSIALSKARKKL